MEKSQGQLEKIRHSLAHILAYALQENKIVFIQGRVDNDRESPKIIAENVEEIIEK